MRDPFAKEKPGKQRTAGQTEDRRQAERLSFSAVATITDPHSQSKLAARIADIGSNGCYADALNVFAVGTVVNLSISHSGQHFEVPATVIYSLPGMGMGLHFKNLPPEMEMILQNWIAEAKGEVTQELTMPAPVAAPAEASAASVSLHSILQRMIGAMMHKGVLTDSEGRELLDDLLKVEKGNQVDAR